MWETNKAVQKYLERYAEPQVDQVSAGGAFGHALVIPAAGESAMLLDTLGSIRRGPKGDVLILLVLNSTQSADTEFHRRNRMLLIDLRRQFEPHDSQGATAEFLWFKHAQGTLLVIDRASEGRYLPEGQGVGLARKIGCDIALSLWDKGRLLSPWIHTTDADARLPKDYFARASEVGLEDRVAAMVYPFWHVPEEDPCLAEAIRLYELFLRYYVLGLAFARSPYAFQTLGSTLAIHAGAYACVRGFPRKAAGEDFYVLNKLSKVGAILSLRGDPIQIVGRASDRVPFGTGRALRDICASRSLGQPFRVYDPRVFIYLRTWLEVLSSLTEESTLGDFEGRVLAAAASELEIDGNLLNDALKRLGAPGAFSQARLKSSRPETLRRHLHIWFDAFRTLKLIHSLTRRALPRIELLDALRQASFTAHAVAHSQPLDSLRLQLANQESRRSQFALPR